MSKQKPSTLQQRFGFLDNDLKTDTHDEIMMWLDRNCKEIIEDTDAYKQMLLNRWNVSEKQRELINEKPLLTPDLSKIRILRKVWEKPIKDKSYIIGFIDFLATFATSALYIEEAKNDRHKREYKIYSDEASFAFEVKTKIPSLGELMRQIRTYKEYISVPFAIVSSDDRYKDLIEEQGFTFVNYDPIKYNK